MAYPVANGGQMIAAYKSRVFAHKVLKHDSVSDYINKCEKRGKVEIVAVTSVAPLFVAVSFWYWIRMESAHQNGEVVEVKKNDQV